jgi:hypothetical protein
LKTSSDDLFRLIKTLNKSEKGYFKKFAARNASGTKQNYIILFDAIDSLEHYDEEKLRKKLKNAPFLNQLAVYKVYLFNLVLKSLHQFGSYDNAESKLSEMLINAKTLTSKFLYKEAGKILKKAKEMAIQYDKMKFMFEILHLERHIAILMPQKDSLKHRQKIFEEQKRLYEKIGNFFEYSWLCDQVTILIDGEALHHNKETANKIDEIMSSDYMQDENRPDGYYAKMNFLHTHLVYNGSKDDTEKTNRYLKKSIDFAEANPHFIYESPQNYAFYLINYWVRCHYANNQKEADAALNKLKLLRQKLRNNIPRETEVQIFYHAANSEMLVYERTGDMKNGRIKARQIERDLREYKSDVPLYLKAILMNNLACFYFIDGDLDSSLKNINSILNETNLVIRKDIIEFAKLFQLLIHYELKNYDLLEYLIPSVMKYLKSKIKNYTKTREKILVEFFTEAVKTDEQGQKELINQLLFRLKKSGIKASGEGTEYFDYILWCESKINNIPLSEAIKTKHQRQ